MNKEWTDTFLQEINEFKDKINTFDKGEMDRKTYKSLSGGLGSYAQRDSSGHMLRLRLPGGRLTTEHLKFLVRLYRQEHVSRMKLTTCETLQLHDLSAQQVPAIMEAAISAGIYTKGGGGDHPRNVIASPLSGVQTGEPFDVTPWVWAVTEYLLSVCRDIHMPRKLKIAFCNGVDDCVHSAFRDMGFLAQADGTFALRIAGGLGAVKPAMGLLVEEHVQPQDVLYYVRAMVDVFCIHGNYENRAKARTRFLQETLGRDGLRETFLRQVSLLKAAGGLGLEKLKPAVPVKQPENTSEDMAVTDPRAIAQKQAGLYAVKYHPLGGILTGEKVCQLYELLKDMDGVELRVAPDETLYIINLTAFEARAVLVATDDGAQTEFEYSVACIGAATCQQGVRDSQAVLLDVIKAVKEAGIADGALPKICISGCPSSCAAHQAGAIGFQGGVKKVGNELLPAFKLMLGGSDRLGEARFGAEKATISERDLAAFLVELGRSVQASGQSWAQWINDHVQECDDIIAKYS